MKPQATGEAPGAELEILIKLHRYETITRRRSVS